MKNKRKMIILSSIAALCFAVGGTVMAEEEANMALHPMAEVEYETQQKTVYIVQVGTFSVYQNAVEFAEKLNQCGFYTDIEWQADEMYRVNSGMYDQYSDAENKQKLLAETGYDSWINEVTKEVFVPRKDVEYLVQVGAFAQQRNAENYVKQLMSQGFGGYVQLEEEGLYHVYCGTYERKEDAEDLKEILESYGYEVYVRENLFQPEILQTYFVVQAGAFSSSENARNYAAELNRSGFNAYFILAESGYYTVFCGTFKEKTNADRLKENLNQAGYEALVIEYQM